MDQATLTQLKTVLRETDIPFFSDSDLEFHLSLNAGDVKATLYRCLLIKAENTTMQISGLSTADSSSYFRRLAAQYRPRNTGVLGGV